MAFHVGSSTKQLDSNLAPNRAGISEQMSEADMNARPCVNYPLQKPFLRYLEKLVNPRIRNDKPTLVKRELPTYLRASRPDGNPYRFIPFERINELKEQENVRKVEERDRCQQARDISEKLPLWVRQRHTAAANLRQVIHEENLKEISKYGRLFEPNNLTAQPVGSQLCQLVQQPFRRTTTRSHSLSIRVPEEENLVDDDVRLGLMNDETKSHDLDTESLDEAAHADKEHMPVRVNDDHEVLTVLKDPHGTHETSRVDGGMRQFVQDRRRVCLLELAARTKRGEVKRLDSILSAENNFLTREEHELLRRHEEHDRYLKSICQRTAEAIRLAENEARKRNEVSEKIKRARYRLAHLNAECVKLEEEYLRLSTYKEFLHKVAEAFREHHTQIKTTLKSKAETPSDPQKIITIPSRGTYVELLTKSSASNVDFEKSQLVESSSSGEPDSSESLFDFFSSPQDLVDILSELESNNLTLIENVQEQEEVCERVRAKAAKLYAMLNVERKTVDDHIARERKNISGIQENVNSITEARNSLSDFVLLNRYAKVFYLGDMNQFENLDPTAWLATSPTQSNKGFSPIGRVTIKPSQSNLNDKNDAEPTISNLLSLLQVQIQKVYSGVYGTNEGGARLDTLVMLRRLETTVDELSEMLNAYPRPLVLKAKRTVDERHRVNARRRQKVETQVAYERRLERAIKKARDPPRRQFGRRVMERSRPPEVKRTLHVGAVSVEPEDDNKSLFQ